MKMKVSNSPTITLRSFLDLVLMWHTSGDVPMDRVAMQRFIEDDSFIVFLESVKTWSKALGLEQPHKRDVVRTLHDLYETS